MSFGCYCYGHCVQLFLDVLPIHPCIHFKTHSFCITPPALPVHGTCMTLPDVCSGSGIGLLMWSSSNDRAGNGNGAQSMVAMRRSCFCFLSQKTASAFTAPDRWSAQASLILQVCMCRTGGPDGVHLLCDRAVALPPSPIALIIINSFINFWIVFCKIL